MHVNYVVASESESAPPCSLNCTDRRELVRNRFIAVTQRRTAPPHWNSSVTKKQRQGPFELYRRGAVRSRSDADSLMDIDDINELDAVATARKRSRHELSKSAG
jgi:hypothetical protein